MKKCKQCSETKALTEFYKDVQQADGKSRRCKFCYNHRRRQVRKGEFAYTNKLREMYGLSRQEHDQLLASQKGLCKICKDAPEPGKRLHIDHCHTTGKVRGLLCRGCNHGIGNFKDKEEFLWEAIHYLKQAQ